MGYYKGDYRICYVDDKYIFSVFFRSCNMFILTKDILETIKATSYACSAEEFENAWFDGNYDEDDTFLYYQSKRKFNH
mgnify:CR=1 FL=1